MPAKKPPKKPAPSRTAKPTAVTKKPAAKPTTKPTPPAPPAKPVKSRSKHPGGFQRPVAAAPLVEGKICSTCGKPLSADPVIAKHHSEFCEPTRQLVTGRGAGRVTDHERLAQELNALDTKYPTAIEDYMLARAKQLYVGFARNTYFKLATMAPSQRATLVSELASRHSLNMLAAELGVNDKTLRAWLKPLQLIAEVQEALDVGERGGISLNHINKFFVPGKGAYAPATPRPREEQLQLLTMLRGYGRARGGKL